MSENAFDISAQSELQAIANAIDASGIDCDAQFKSDGVLELEFGDRSRVVINRHSAAREIWLASRAGGRHFREVETRWIDTRDGRDLRDVLADLIEKQLGERVSFAA